MPLLVLVVVAVGALVVYRMQGLFGSNNEITRPGAGLADDAEPFEPKVVTYEIFGISGAAATINYLDLDSTAQEVQDASLPWSITLETTNATASATIIAQGDGDMISCRIVVDGEIMAENASDGVSAQTYCLVKSA